MEYVQEKESKRPKHRSLRYASPLLMQPKLVAGWFAGSIAASHSFMVLSLGYCHCSFPWSFGVHLGFLQVIQFPPTSYKHTSRCTGYAYCSWLHCTLPWAGIPFRVSHCLTQRSWNRLQIYHDPDWAEALTEDEWMNKLYLLDHDETQQGLESRICLFQFIPCDAKVGKSGG